VNRPRISDPDKSGSNGVPVVFPLELCHTDQVSVHEAQILSGSPRQQ